VLFFSSAITLMLTLTQLYLDYRRDVGAIDQRMSEIDSGYHQSLGEALATGSAPASIASRGDFPPA
jgi:hypothetical protein